MIQNENNLNEIEQERASYLLNLDDMNYETLAEPLVIRNKSAMSPGTYIGVMGEINLINGMIYPGEFSENEEITKILDIQSNVEIPKRKFQQVRPATFEDELTGNPSYKE